MRIISLKPVRDFSARNPKCNGALTEWVQIMLKASPGSFMEMKAIFNSVDKVGKFYVFDIGGNKCRLISAIHFNTQILYVRYVLTHKEYDKGDWKP